MKSRKYLVSAAAAALLCGCQLMSSYELDTTANYLGETRMIDYLNQGRDTSLTMYAAALGYTGLDEVISNGELQTVVVPTNTAVKRLLSDAGYTQMTDLNRGVLRALLEYLIVPGRYVSYEMADGVDNKAISLTGDRIYFSRVSTTADKYPVTINRTPDDDPDFASSPIPVSKQDHIFKDKVAQIVDMFPTFQIRIQSPDVAPEGGGDGGAMVKLATAGDTQAYSSGGSKAYYDQSVQLVYRSGSNAGQNRTGMILFEDKDVAFADDIVSAALNVYVESNTISPACPTFDVFDITDVEPRPLIREITKDFKPTLGSANYCATSPQLTVGGWNQIDITDFIVGHYAGEPAGRKSIFFALRPTDKSTGKSGTIKLGWLDEQENDEMDPEDHNSAYITIFGPMETELTVAENNALVCPRGGNVLLGKETLCMTGESEKGLVYTDNNIIYVLTRLPEDGVVTRNGLPLGLKGKFTQEEMRCGVVKYFHNGNSASDSFEVQVKDYAGGMMNSTITVPVTVE